MLMFNLPNEKKVTYLVNRKSMVMSTMKA